MGLRVLACANILPSDNVIAKRVLDGAIVKLTNEDTAQAAKTAVRTKNFIESVLGDEATKVC